MFFRYRFSNKLSTNSGFSRLFTVSEVGTNIAPTPMVSPLACIVVATVRATTYNLAFSFAWHQPWRSSWGSSFRPYIVAGAVVAFGPARHT